MESVENAMLIASIDAWLQLLITKLKYNICKHLLLYLPTLILALL